MNPQPNDDKPAILMLSHCVPDAVGSADRTRAWQLLRLAGHHHRVSLACLMDSPVNLAQWRTVLGQAEQAVIEASPPRRWWAGLSHDPRGNTTTWATQPGGPLAETIGRWVSRERFDAVLCTHPWLWSYARHIDASIKACDLPLSFNLPRHQLHLRRPNPLQHLIAAESDLIILERPDERHYFADKAAQTIVLPTQIDADFFTTLRSSPLTKRYAGHGMGVAFHGDWTRGHTHGQFARFRRRVWPSIKRVVRHAQLGNSLPGATDPFTTLREASVIVTPLPDTPQAHLPILQAMAMQRAVVASGQTIGRLNLGVQHCQHLMLCGDERDWIMHCIELLRSASHRLNLSRNARTFIDRQPTIDQTGARLTQALARHNTTYDTINRAA